MNKETLKLFNAIQVDTKKKSKNLMLDKTIKHGFVLSPEVAAIADDVLIKEISQVIGLSGDKANSSFHKSWRIVRDTPQEVLAIQQAIHYMTTYGFEQLGIYSEEAVYIPAEKLNVPKIKDDIKLVVIKGLTRDEILDNIKKLGSSIALADVTLKAIMTIVEHNQYGCFVDNVSNYELKSLLYDYYDIVPQKPIDFLRFVVSRITGDSLLIKNPATIAKIKASDTTLHRRTLDKALKKAPHNLAEIFFRFKPLFLALKKVSGNKKFFNQLRRKANTQHRPMPEDYLNTVTAKLKSGKRIYLKDLRAALADANIFRKIRLANALAFRMQDPNAIVYRVRTGRGYATSFSFADNSQSGIERILEVVKESIATSLDVKGKKFFIPENVNYAMPATEKQFTGNFPTGTSISVPKDMVVGIHWFNTTNRIDLDLSVLSASGKIGWDAGYSSRNKNVLFSGDMTSAPRPKGASELFYLQKGFTEDHILLVNYFNFMADDPVETYIMLGEASSKDFKKNYTIDPNKIIAATIITVDQKENILGLIRSEDGVIKFYFANVNVGASISSYRGSYSTQAREYFVDMSTSMLDLREMLTLAGAKVITEKPKKGKFIDLSPEALDKTTIIDILNAREA